jgi:hypothetical protein
MGYFGEISGKKQKLIWVLDFWGLKWLWDKLVGMSVDQWLCGCGAHQRALAGDIGHKWVNPRDKEEEDEFNSES